MKKRFILIITLVLLLCITWCKGKEDEPNTHTHEIEKKDAVSVTCNSHGNIEYYVCNSCNKLFKDEEGKIEISSE